MLIWILFLNENNELFNVFTPLLRAWLPDFLLARGVCWCLCGVLDVPGEEGYVMVGVEMALPAVILWHCC